VKRDTLFHAVHGALDPEHCAVCHLSLESVRRFLDGFLYERVNDPWAREELIQARGFCPVHGWQLRSFRDSPTGVAIVYHHLLAEFYRAFTNRTEQRAVAAASRWLPWSPSTAEAGRDVSRWLEPRVPCPACADQWEAEARYVWAAAAAADDEDFRARYAISLGLCVRHLAAVMEQIRQPADLEWLVAVERKLIEQLLCDLSEFWRKHDYRFRDEPMSHGERMGWTRVLYKVGGGPGMVWRP
jgi:hypothetical protein